MKYSFNALSLILLSALPANVLSHETHQHEVLEWDNGHLKMPTPLSDMSANVVSTSDEKFIVIVGGCDNENGNEFVADDTYGDFFTCFSITDKVQKFTPEDGKFTELKTAPRKRYRHAGIEVGGKLWVVGGRDGEDGLIAEIDIYDPVKDTWSTPISLPPEYLTSDNAAFTDSSGKKVFVAGGWSQNYEALTTTISIDVEKALNGILEVEEKAPLNVARGDIHAASTEDKSYAYVTGGFTDENIYCAPMSSVERYNVGSNKWETVKSLNTPRGDKALVEMNGRIFAVGGERKLEAVCDETKADELPHLGSQSVPVDDAEVLDPSEGSNAEWKVMEDLPNFRFRFQAAAWDESNTIYTFGGQKMYDPTCNCFAASDAVVSYIDVEDNDGLSTGAIFGIVIGALAGLAILVIAVKMMCKKKSDIETNKSLEPGTLPEESADSNFQAEPNENEVS